MGHEATKPRHGKCDNALKSKQYPEFTTTKVHNYSLQSRCLPKHPRVNYKHFIKTALLALPLRLCMSAVKCYGTFQEETGICREQAWIIYRTLLQSDIL